MKSTKIPDTEQFVCMLNREISAAHDTHMTMSESLVTDLVSAGDILGPVIFVGNASLGNCILRGKLSYSRFRKGDDVEIRMQTSGDQSDLLYNGWQVVDTYYPEPGIIDIVLKGNLNQELKENTEYFIFPALTTKFTAMMIQRLREIQNEKEVVLGDGYYDLKVNNTNYRAAYENLNKAQQTAINCLIENNLSGAVQGPPGTGKTQLLQAVATLALNSNMTIAVASFTNAAVDNLLSRLITLDDKINWYRIGNYSNVRSELYQHIENFNIGEHLISSFPQNEDYVQMLGTTLSKLAHSRKAPVFDLLIIDEAGQVPLYFWQFISRFAKRVVMVGDQYQLPPVLAAEHTYLPVNNVFSLMVDSKTPMLETQYRMHREIQEWSSHKFYHGRLNPHESVANRNYFEHSPALITDGTKNNVCLDEKTVAANPEAEANYIVSRIEKVIKNNIPLNKVGIICPFRAQAGLINAALQSRFGVDKASEILVDTVERFQGQEKEAIFLSLGNPNSLGGSVEFLSNPKRLNVSVTRAKSKFYCVYNKQLLDRSNKASDLNEFLRWMGDSTTQIRKAV